MNLGSEGVFLSLREGLMVPDIRRRVATVCVVSAFLCVRAVAQEGHYGVGHDRWDREFYSKLNRNDGKGTCCNLMDCRPTQSRMVGDHYEVKVDGEWTPVPNDRINNVVAPDGGAHVCAPPPTSRPEQRRAVLRRSSPGGLTKAVRLRLGAPSETTYIRSYISFIVTAARASGDGSR